MKKEQNLKKPKKKKQTLNMPVTNNRICDYCGEEHPLMQDNKDGSFTCLPCLIKIDDGNDIDNSMGCDW